MFHVKHRGDNDGRDYVVYFISYNWIYGIFDIYYMEGYKMTEILCIVIGILIGIFVGLVILVEKE